MLETSQDLFYLVLAFSILWFTVFLCITLYYVIRLLRQTNEVFSDFREKVTHAMSIFTFLKSKAVSEAVKGVVGAVKKRKTKNKK
ncbi:hypothetical protein HN858_02585 [Candidatus Falkowbacteria bacterium]|jgi:hypothetical protein|nr:hypothetical protein [Candidatus Falkowbacteria bacterium]MBT5503822.1 hypothetical protein [Candidatus Falkowbacteria bacterium]MBT6573853.1 hypothetical protein [Candidatus Falkowbacteria bacterium]MBT7348543.1 hypothetical protein [Candidatus Falkowbacteria bacterium]MBT7501073.1 hypothetical protein [Candidatus Falkowbacteria bacterium]